MGLIYITFLLALNNFADYSLALNVSGSQRCGVNVREDSPDNVQLFRSHYFDFKSFNNTTPVTPGMIK